MKKLDKGVAAVDARRSLKEARSTPGLTQDELTQQKEEETDDKWKRNGSPNEVESSLRIDLQACFETKKLKTNTARFEYFKKQFDELAITPMSCSTFTKFMSGQRTNNLKKGQREQLEMMLAKHDESQRSTCQEPTNEDV